ncbi:MAG: GAF domain-containing protein, partial [Alcanivorax sp.]|nr:GAF domain-containing protein [Alcanivorax sp.]
MNSFLPDTTSVTDENLLPRMLRVAQHLSEQRDVPRLLQVLLDEALYLCEADTGWVWLYADGKPEPGLSCLCRRAGDASLHEEASLFCPMARKSGLPEQCYQDGKPLAVDLSRSALSEEDRYLLDALAPDAGGLRLWPLRNHEGMVIGVL